MEDDADALPAALDQLAEAARAHISARAVDALLVAALADLAARAEAALLHNRYDRVLQNIPTYILLFFCN